MIRPWTWPLPCPFMNGCMWMDGCCTCSPYTMMHDPPPFLNDYVNEWMLCMLTLCRGCMTPTPIMDNVWMGVMYDYPIP